MTGGVSSGKRYFEARGRDSKACRTLYSGRRADMVHYSCHQDILNDDKAEMIKKIEALVNKN